MQLRLKDIHAAGAKVVAISTDSVETNEKVVLDLNLGFSILSDPELTAIDAYRLRHAGASIDGTDIARPAVFIVDRNGIVQWHDLTENWRVRVRPETVLEQLAAIPR